jgi:hypothetical protein
VTVVRREHRAHFTIVPNAVFADARLSVEAKGVLGYLLSRPHKWRVRLEHVGRTLKVGRKKLQRIFRELIGAGYVTREPQRFAPGHRFGDLDYVVRDVPLALALPVETSTVPRGQKGPPAPRGQKGPAYKDSPQVRNGPAYKETYKNGETEPPGFLQTDRPIGGSTAEDRRSTGDHDDARLDIGIVGLFADKAEGWEFLTVLPDDVLAQLRKLQRQGKLDKAALIGAWNRYGHLLRGRLQARQRASGADQLELNVVPEVEAM